MKKINKETQASPSPFVQTYLHGTKADLNIGDLIEVGYNSNFGQRKSAKYIFLSATLDAAIWGAELAFGDGQERIYLVEPTGEIEDDPDLTDQKFPGNPSKSYRSTQPFRVVGEVTIWQGHQPDQINAMKEGIRQLNEQGITSINDEQKSKIHSNRDCIMKIETHHIKDKKIAEIITDEIILTSTEDGLELIGNLYYQGFDKIILLEKNIIPDFFDLKTKVAGDILQKFTQYRMSLAIVGDFSKYQSKSLKDFISESNKGRNINFVHSIEEAIN